MWMLDNRTPYAAERSWALDRNAAKHWVVVVKATFDILPDGTTRLAENQVAPLLVEEYRGEPGKSSLRYDADLVLTKRATDVLLDGHAYAPNGKPTRHLTASLSVQRLKKQLLVTGDRIWEYGLVRTLAPTAPEPFEKIPIIYERAFGGWDTKAPNPADHRLEPRNPVGMGFATRSDHLLGQPVPNIEDPAHPILSWKDRPRPMGFGPPCSYWTPRLGYAGTYDARWQKERYPLVPEDFDDRFYQAAPEDQQVEGFLKGGETVELQNLSPQGRLVFTLPKVYPVFTTCFRKRQVEHRAKLYTVILEPDVPRVLMVWQTALSCHHQVDDLDVTVIREKAYL